ncbi:MAG: acetate--CoA ligase family protein [Deltaproteobacteria bacterium]|jgi:acyl-CoA synthetase (NDP forming)|nr:acetate--CoA ligase family protein [Deltaproteobacteria bacterium]
MKDTLSRLVKEGVKLLPELEAAKLCSIHGILTPPSRTAADTPGALVAARELGYPVVLKVLSRQIIHKSEAGGVIVGIESDRELEKACQAMAGQIRAKVPGAQIDGLLIQKMMPKGVEVVVGALRNAEFGPVVMFGLGGVYVEVFKDVEFRLAPLSQAEAGRQIEATKVSRILKGVRGESPRDLEALRQLLVNVGDIICRYHEIKEIDLNPIVSYAKGYAAVDVRVIVGQ